MVKKINCPNKNIYFIRANKTKYGRAENYLFIQLEIQQPFLFI